MFSLFHHHAISEAANRSRKNKSTIVTSEKPVIPEIVNNKPSITLTKTTADSDSTVILMGRHFGR